MKGQILTFCLFYATAFSVFSAFGCGDDEKEVVVSSIGPAGGTIGTSSGVSLEIPPGALTEEVEFTITEIATPKSDIFVAVGTFVDIQPAGTDFLKPATLTMPYSASKIPEGQTDADVRIYQTKELSSGKWVPLSTTVADGKASAQLDHLCVNGPGKLLGGNKPPDDCGGGCKADLGKARTLLDQGDIAGAFAEYSCADTAEAAMGAGITGVLLLAESGAATSFLNEFQLSPFKLSDLFGSNGYLPRLGKIWDGQGDLNLDGIDLTGQLSLIRVRSSVYTSDTGSYSELYVKAANNKERSYPAIRFDVQDPSTVSSGTKVDITYDCITGYRNDTTISLGFSLDLNKNGKSYYCRIPYSVDPSICTPTGGSVTFTQTGSNVGDPVELTFDNLLLLCDSHLDPDPGCGGGNDEGGNGSTSPGLGDIVYLSGTIQDSITDEKPDDSAYHPVIQDGSVLEEVKSSVTLGELATRFASWAGDLQTSACFFSRAQELASSQISFPNIAFGGDDMIFSKGDAGVFAAAAKLGAAMLKIAESYDVPLDLKTLLCGESCPTDEARVQTVNANIGSLKQSHQYDTARQLVDQAIKDAQAALAQLGEQGMIKKMSSTSGAMAVFDDFLAAASTALSSGSTPVPDVTPEITVDLKKLFEAPPNPTDVTTDLLVCETDPMDPPGTPCEMKLVEAFFNDLLQSATNADWDNWDYNFPQQKEDDLEVFFNELSCYLLQYLHDLD